MVYKRSQARAVPREQGLADDFLFIHFYTNALMLILAYVYWSARQRGLKGFSSQRLVRENFGHGRGKIGREEMRCEV